MIQATTFHRGMHVGPDGLREASAVCPVCRSAALRRAVFVVQRAPDIDMLECSACGACSASRMPTTALLDHYYASYYQGTAERHTLSEPDRFARHVLRFMPDAGRAGPVRILDFGGGDGSLAIALARRLRARGVPGPFSPSMWWITPPPGISRRPGCGSWAATSCPR